MDLGLKGKKVVVSGSTAGIGFAIAAALAAEGAQVIVNGRTDARVTAALNSIRQRVKNADVRGTAADLGTASGVAAFLQQAPEGAEGPDHPEAPDRRVGLASWSRTCGSSPRSSR